MPTESTSLNNVTLAGDSHTTDEMVVGISKIYQRPFLIVAGSLLTVLLWLAVTGKSGGQHSKLSAHEFDKAASVLADYQADTANSALVKDIFGIEIEDGSWCPSWRCSNCSCDSPPCHECKSCGKVCTCVTHNHCPSF